MFLHIVYTNMHVHVQYMYMMYKTPEIVQLKLNFSIHIYIHEIVLPIDRLYMKCALTHNASATIEHDGKHQLKVEHTTNISVVLAVVTLKTTTHRKEIHTCTCIYIHVDVLHVECCLVQTQ